MLSPPKHFTSYEEYMRLFTHLFPHKKTNKNLNKLGAAWFWELLCGCLCLSCFPLGCCALEATELQLVLLVCLSAIP